MRAPLILRDPPAAQASIRAEEPDAGVVELAGKRDDLGICESGSNLRAARNRLNLWDSIGEGVEHIKVGRPTSLLHLELAIRGNRVKAYELGDRQLALVESLLKAG